MKDAWRNEGKLTELTKEVLAAKDLMHALAKELIAVSLDAFGDVQVLALDTIFDAALLAVEKTAWNGDVSVGLESLK